MITIRIDGLDKLIGGVTRAASTLATEARRAMEASCLLVEGTARGLAPRDTGRLQGSITSRITGGGANLTGEIGPSVAYGLYVEKSTRPHFPPVGAVAGWAGRHGVSPFAVARGIARRGTRAQPFLVPALMQNRGRVEQAWAKLGARVVAVMAGG